MYLNTRLWSRKMFDENGGDQRVIFRPNEKKNNLFLPRD